MSARAPEGAARRVREDPEDRAGAAAAGEEGSDHSPAAGGQPRPRGSAYLLGCPLYVSHQS